VRDLRYGENHHQKASVFEDRSGLGGLALARVVQGKDMSYNNYLDAESAVRAVSDHGGPTVAIVKHQNPCGIANDRTLAAAFSMAHKCDPVSAFGGVVAANESLDEETAREIVKMFFEVVVAPGVSKKAMQILSKKNDLRVIDLGALPQYSEPEWRQISGGFLIQDLDRNFSRFADWELVAGAPVDSNESSSLEFAWRAVRSVKSNAIVLSQGHATVGIGMGQVNRLDSARLAVQRAGERVSGSVATSDAFFPFTDGLQVLLDAGVKVVIQPGGSYRDQEVIDCAEAAGATMYFTGERHFSH
jgi:phosphoribosylaminoimidazolecarboxamide formyltransferase/IMP cyclohydrolase